MVQTDSNETGELVLFLYLSYNEKSVKISVFLVESKLSLCLTSLGHTQGRQDFIFPRAFLLFKAMTTRIIIKLGNSRVQKCVSQNKRSETFWVRATIPIFL